MTGTPPRRDFRARFVDPDTGKTKYVSLTHKGLTTADGRRTWAVAKSKALAARRVAIELGARLRSRTDLATAVEQYLARCAYEHRKATIESYTRSLGLLTAWAKRERIEIVEQIDPPALVRLRDHLVARRRRDGERLAASSVNHDLRAISTAMRSFRRRGYCPSLTRDEITDNLRRVPEPRPAPAPLTPNECAKLLEACIRHDVATFDLTRKEHAKYPSAKSLGLTRRYAPVSPLILFLLLSGARAGEAFGLRWASVDLTERDGFGNETGVVRLPPELTKTRTGRDIDLTVAPGLRALLLAMTLRRGSDGFVFGGRKPLKKSRARADMRRVVSKFEAPEFSPQRLRQTAAAYLVNSAGIFGSASIYRSCAQLGHSPDVASRAYLDVIRGVPREARTIEAAMRVERQVAAIVALARGADPASIEFDRGAA